VILAIDGVLITTSEGGRRYANIKPGDTVELTVRRGRETMNVGLIADARCALINVAPEPVVAPEPALAPLPDATPPPMVAPVPDVKPYIAVSLLFSFPSGWFGFGIDCRCDIQAGRDGNPPVWKFREAPEVYSVEEDSPAGEAGLRHGDLLIEIDGEDITSDEGGRRFGAVRAGDTVTFKYRRGRQTAEVTMTARARPDRDDTGAQGAEAELLLRGLLERRMVVEPEGRILLEEAIRSGNLESREAEELISRIERERASERVALLELEQLLLRDAVPVPDIEPSDQLRFAGVVGDVEVEVRGNRSVVAAVIEEGKEIVIITRDARIRIRLPEH
jgi:S1-C subfamily serine protease